MKPNKRMEFVRGAHPARKQLCCLLATHWRRWAKNRPSMMRLSVTAYLCSIGLLLSSHAQGEGALATTAPLLYSVTTDSETVNSWSLGIVTGFVGEAYRKSHEAFLATLRSNTDGGSRQQRLLKPFACLGFDTSAEECRRLIEVNDGMSDRALTALLRSEPTRSARVVELRIIFDGRFFQVPTRLYDIQLTDKDLLFCSRLIRGVGRARC